MAIQSRRRSRADDERVGVKADMIWHGLLYLCSGNRYIVCKINIRPNISLRLVTFALLGAVRPLPESLQDERAHSPFAAQNCVCFSLSTIQICYYSMLSFQSCEKKVCLCATCIRPSYGNRSVSYCNRFLPGFDFSIHFFFIQKNRLDEAR